ncbi:MAG TPA: hypothetical protein VIT00_14075 [Terrimicrobiaceae bacterium]
MVGVETQFEEVMVTEAEGADEEAAQPDLHPISSGAWNGLSGACP